MRVVVRDGKIESSEPGGMFGYIDIPRNEWRQNFPYA